MLLSIFVFFVVGISLCTLLYKYGKGNGKKEFQGKPLDNIEEGKAYFVRIIPPLPTEFCSEIVLLLMEVWNNKKEKKEVFLSLPVNGFKNPLPMVIDPLKKYALTVTSGDNFRYFTLRER